MNRLRWSCALTFNQFVAFFVNPFRSKNVRSIAHMKLLEIFCITLKLQMTNDRQRARGTVPPSSPPGSAQASRNQVRPLFLRQQPLHLASLQALAGSVRLLSL